MRKDNLNFKLIFTRFRRAYIAFFSMLATSNAIWFILTAKDEQITNVLKATSLFYISIAIGLGTLSSIYTVNMSKIEVRSYALDILLLIATSFFGYWITLAEWGVRWQRAALLIGVIIIISLILAYSINLGELIEKNIKTQKSHKV